MSLGSTSYKSNCKAQTQTPSMLPYNGDLYIPSYKLTVSISWLSCSVKSSINLKTAPVQTLCSETSRSAFLPHLTFFIIDGLSRCHLTFLCIFIQYWCWKRGGEGLRVEKVSRNHFIWPLIHPNQTNVTKRIRPKFSTLQCQIFGIRN